MPKDNIFYLRLSNSERLMLKSLAEKMTCTESQAMRTVLAAAANELMPTPSNDLREIFRNLFRADRPTRGVHHEVSVDAALERASAGINRAEEIEPR